MVRSPSLPADINLQLPEQPAFRVISYSTLANFIRVVGLLITIYFLISVRLHLGVYDASFHVVTKERPKPAVKVA